MQEQIEEEEREERVTQLLSPQGLQEEEKERGNENATGGEEGWSCSQTALHSHLKIFRLKNKHGSQVSGLK